MESEGRQRNGPAMTVLQNPELLERILQYLSGCKKTLVSASLTTKAFSEPAFNILWYEMNSLWPLFRVLPTFERRTEGEFVFTGPIRNEHLQRVLYYSRRIRVFHYNGSNPISAARGLLISTLIRMDRLGAFVPLRRIYFHDFSKAVLFPLTSPNLDTIDMKIGKPLSMSIEIEVASFLQSVASQSPPLRSLAIEGPMRGATLQVLPDFIKLERLTLLLESLNLPEQFLQRLASSMPSLRSLQIEPTCSHIAQPKDMPQRLGQPHSIFRLYFPSLETLVIRCNSAYLEGIFGVLDAPLLKSVSLAVSQSHPNVSADMHKFVERNGQILKETVYRLVIGAVVDPCFGIVKSFERLRELNVWASSGAISMSHIADVFNYSGSWSRSLACLQLKQHNPTNTLDCMSIAALCVIADACPNLKSLEISIYRPDEPEKQIVEKKEGQENKTHCLAKLVFLNLPTAWNDTMTLAIGFVSLLGHLFPSMAVPEYTGGKTDRPNGVAKREAWWRGVQDMWRMCQTMKDRQNDKQPL